MLDFESQIQQNLLKISSFTTEQIKGVLEKLHVQSFRKNDYLLAPPKVCRFTAIVLRGGFRMFQQKEKKQHTLHFFTENDWVGDFESFVVQQPTRNHIQATEKAEVAVLSIQDIHALIGLDKAYLSLGKVMKEWSVTSHQYTSLIDDNPDARYQRLLETHPDWILRFPQIYLAAYLGMSRETFSRTKARRLSIS